MRKLLISVIIILLLILILPAATGQIAKNKFMEFVDAVSKSPNIQLQVKNYQQGWFKSTADVDVTVSNATPQTKLIGPLTFTVHQVIKHGPILLSDHNVHFGYALAESQFEFTDKVKATLSNFIPSGQKLPLIKSQLLFPFGGGGNLKFSLPAFVLEKAQQGKFSWKGAEARFNYNREMNARDGDIKLDGFHFSSVSPQVQVQHEGSQVSFQLQQVEGLWVGKSDVDFSKLSVQMEGKDTLLISDLTSHSESNIQDHLFSISFQILVDKWQRADQVYGPGKLVLSVNKLDAPALLNLKQHIEAASDPRVNDQQRQLMLMAAFPLLPSVFDKSPEIQLHNLTLQTPQGLLRANGNVTVTTDSNQSNKGFAALFKQLKGELNLEVPKQLVEKWLHASISAKMRQEQSVQAAINETAAKTAKEPSTTVPATRLTDSQIDNKAAVETTTQLAGWVKDGYLVESGDAYKLHAIYQNEVLTINGKLLNQQAKTTP